MPTNWFNADLTISELRQEKRRFENRIANSAWDLARQHHETHRTFASTGAFNAAQVSYLNILQERRFELECERDRLGLAIERQERICAERRASNPTEMMQEIEHVVLWRRVANEVELRLDLAVSKVDQSRLPIMALDGRLQAAQEEAREARELWAEAERKVRGLERSFEMTWGVPCPEYGEASSLTMEVA